LAPAELTLLTDAGEVVARVLGAATAEIGLPPVRRLEAVPGIELMPGERAAWLTTVGVPHLVVLVDDVDRVDLGGRGKQLRHHPAVGAAGANANFISAPRTPGGPWLIRTFERGVEGETLACGTGTVAAALMLHQLGVDDLPAVFRSWGGNVLGVTAVTAQGGYSDVRLEGEGRLVFEGKLP
jgi:diaminopimelate epimerase